MNKQIITERVQELRAYMKEHMIDAVVICDADPHGSEYVPERWKARTWISGFSGSAGTAVVTHTDARLWTDSRYWLAAEEELAQTPFTLMKDGDPSTPGIREWLLQHFDFTHRTYTLSVDGRVMSLAAVEDLMEECRFKLKYKDFPIDALWKDRPADSKAVVSIQPMIYAGESAREKIDRLAAELRRLKAGSMVVTQLDEVAWLTNLRGSDIHCNPVFCAYLLVTEYGDAKLMIHKYKLTPEVKAHLRAEGISVVGYKQHKQIYDMSWNHLHPMLVDPNTVSYEIVNLSSRAYGPLHKVLHPSPVAAMKAQKNPAEIEGFRQAHLRDGVAMVRFLHWLEQAVPQGGQTELSVAEKLEQFRAEGELYRGTSFDTISAYAHHAAIVHYEPTPQTDIPLQPKGMLLLDSGAQYQDGTTDITRTISLGELTEEEMTDYTLVLKGHIRLAMTRFPKGTCGTQIDITARYAMWQQGINYGHGTGHGVGSYLCVHEGPHQIRMNHKPAPLLSGTIVTNEPGIYRAGKHGVRIENIMLVEPFMQTEYGEFLQLHPLTLCPIDTKPIVREQLDSAEVEYLNAYHRRVYEELSPLLAEAERTWLREATKEI